jgi:hypothetical protein
MENYIDIIAMILIPIQTIYIFYSSDETTFVAKEYFSFIFIFNRNQKINPRLFSEIKLLFLWRIQTVVLCSAEMKQSTVKWGFSREWKLIWI